LLGLVDAILGVVCIDECSDTVSDAAKLPCIWRMTFYTFIQIAIDWSSIRHVDKVKPIDGEEGNRMRSEE
jgi:hypothetical protein